MILNFISLTQNIQNNLQVLNNQISTLYYLMGNSNTSQYNLDKGEGFRIIEIKQGSPFLGQVEEFFDFIIQVIPPQQQKSTADILDKLAPQPNRKVIKSPIQIINQNVDKVVQVKIVSTKYRNVRTIQITPKIKSASNNDAIGLTLRKQRFDEVFDTYFPVTDIQNNSPIKKAGIREGQYLIGCVQYPYKTIDAFMEGLYQRFFDKEVKQKSVHLVIYDLATDHLSSKEVILKRGWGGKGLLGCQFLQGLLNKFPNNLEAQRVQIKQKEQKRKEVERLRNELGDCDGASKSLVQSLERQKNKRAKHFKNIKNLLNIEPPILNNVKQEKKENIIKEQKSQNINEIQRKRISQLETRVSSLENALYSVKQYLSKLQQQDDSQQKL